MRNMKDSKTEWLADIPNEWELSNISSLYTLRNEKVSDRDYPPLSVTMKGVVPQLDTAAKTNAHDDRKLVKKGDFAINSRSDRRGSCGIAKQDGSVSLINIVLAPREEMNPDYFNWLFHSSQFADEFYRWGHGIVDDLWTTRWQEMKKIEVPVPKYEEQLRIAGVLDGLCKKVDKLIENQEKQINKLSSYKQSLISETITRGLNPNGKMACNSKAYPIIREDALLMQLRFLTKLYGRIGFRGYTQDDLVSEGEGPITLSPSNMKDMTTVFDKCSYLR